MLFESLPIDESLLHVVKKISPFSFIACSANKRIDGVSPDELLMNKIELCLTLGTLMLIL